MPCPWLRPFPLSPEGCLAFPSVIHADLLSRSRTESTWPLTLPVAPLRSPDSAGLTEKSQRIFHLPRANAADFQNSKCLPPTGPFHPTPHRSSGRSFQAATGTSALHASAQLPTCVHAWLSRARPTPPRLLPRFGLSHMLPIEFCSRKDPQAHLRESQTPAALMTGKPASTGWRRLLRSHTN